MSALVVAATGHRPRKLGTYRNARAESHLQRVAGLFLETLRPDQVVVGMAPGWDTIVARAALVLRIPLVAAVPMGELEQRHGWSDAEVAEHVHILRQCARVEIIGAELATFRDAAHKRNRWMIDRADVGLANWDGSNSGTSNAVRYAESCGVPVVNLWGI